MASVIVLDGHLGSDPEMRVMPLSQTEQVLVNIALNRKKRSSASNEAAAEEVTPVWVTLQFHGNLAVRANNEVRKGDKLTVTGEFDDFPVKEGRRLVVKVVSFEVVAKANREKMKMAS